MKSTAWILAGLMGATCLIGSAFAADDVKKGETASQKAEQKLTMERMGVQPGQTERMGGQPGYKLGKMGKITSATDITGMAVKNAAGEDLGNIKEILVDADQGRVVYLVVASGGILGIGESEYIVPFSVLHKDASAEHFTLAMDTQRIKDGPKFAERRLDDPEFAREVHSYYGVSPWWTEEGARQQQLQERERGEKMMQQEKMKDEGEGMKREMREENKK